MTKVILSLFVFVAFATQAFAQETGKRLRVREVRDAVEVNALPQENTCLDEYIERRDNIAMTLGLSPLIGAGEVAGGTIAGAATGAIIAKLFIQDGWVQLGAFLGGGMIGAAIGAGVFVTTTTISSVKFANNERLIKWVAETRLNRLGKVSKSMLKKYKKRYPNDEISQDLVSNILTDLDTSAMLCDGSIVGQRRYRNGRLLRQRLATRNEIFKHIHSLVDIK